VSSREAGPGRDRGRSWRPVAAIACAVLLSASVAAGQTDTDGASPLPQPSGTSGPIRAIGDEARRYLLDTRMIFTSPLSWEASQWIRAGAYAGMFVALLRYDQNITSAAVKNRSSATMSASSAVTPFGSYVAVGTSLAALGGGWLLKDNWLRDTGRDAIEAEILAAGVVTPVLKAVIGRERPIQGGDSDEYRSLSSNASFPSGHATEAFAVASVFAARSSGWVIPTISYTLATMVGLARIHDQAHYASDVFAGAVIGTTIGRSIVHRHIGESERASWEIAPFAAPRGAGLAIRIGIDHPAPHDLFDTSPPGP
jgi:hypothetical protein